MTMRKRGRIGIGVALLAAVLSISSCSSRGNKPLTEEQIAAYRMDEQRLIVETIPDKSRKSGIAELLSERDLLLERYSVLLCDHAENLRSLNADYKATRDQYSQVFDEYNKDRWVMTQEFVQVIAGMKELTTAAEWREIAKFQQKYLSGRKLTIERVVGGDACS